MTTCWIRNLQRCLHGIGANEHGSVPIRFKGKSGQVVLDQIRTVDKSRLVKRVGTITDVTRAQVLTLLAELFAP